ncbi:hypothetical protein EVAR_83922_1 [Eumeta japonica]|uniref:Uncharacterized protein n=1 Tax=Eumeta variegata TaxID=151549 RepID=A0A4C1US23_EUMVA|nr:hypothetical protein EVAR_83922_1 [Eumeta japonica]
MPSSSRTFRVSSPTEALLDPESGSSYDDSEFSDDDDAEYLVTSAKKKIQQNLSNDEELPPQVAASARFMEAEMDVDHEKLLSGDVNFKWQRDFTAFTAVREEFFCPPSWCDNDKQPLPNAKSKQPLAASNQPVTDWHDHCSPLRRCNGVGMEGCKIVSMISTFHDNSTYTGTRAGEECEKPMCENYNTTMGALI